ncbi:MAG: M48 family metalloprotease [Methermicoccaceae archaeon]
MLRGIIRGLLALCFAELSLVVVGYLLLGRFAALLVLFSLALTIWLLKSGWRVLLDMYGCRRASIEECPTLFRALKDVCERAHTPQPELYLMDTPTPNAMAVGRGGGCAAVCVSEALLGLLDEEELRAVLAHEMSHIIERNVLFSSASAIAGIFLAHLGQAFLYGAEEEECGIATMMLGGVMLPVAHLVVLCGYSRGCEFRADAFSARLTSKSALSSALLKTEANAQLVYINSASAHLFFSPPIAPKKLRGLFSLHPSTAERLRRLDAL